MSVIAQYRLPHAHSYTRVEQTDGEPLSLLSCSELNGRHGFVVAPFQISQQQPLLLIRPDVVTRHEVVPADYHPAGILHTDDHQANYAVDFANYHAQLKKELFRKIVLARCAVLTLAADVDPYQLFLSACQHYPRLFISLVILPDGTSWLTATPEILLERVGSQWRTIALAGTMQLQGEELEFDNPPLQGDTSQLDLRWSTKNIQEQRYVATYIAECLEHFSLSYQEEGPRTVRAANLVHLRSDFTFTMTDRERVGSLLERLHPTPAVCGLPKQDTFQFIVQNEQTPRQYYSGFMGPLELSGETHLYVSLRCMQMRRDTCRLYAGGGLLKDSLLELEWQETEAKMQTMRQLLI